MSCALWLPQAYCEDLTEVKMRETKYNPRGAEKQPKRAEQQPTRGGRLPQAYYDKA
jgi:hypothetical protein